MQPLDDSSRSHIELENALRKICSELGEKRVDARDIIRMIAKAQGLDFVRSHVERAHQVQAQGGMLVPDGSRNRTLGGVFFTMVKETMGVEAYRLVTLDHRQRYALREERWARIEEKSAAAAEMAAKAESNSAVSTEH